MGTVYFGDNTKNKALKEALSHLPPFAESQRYPAVVCVWGGGGGMRLGFLADTRAAGSGKGGHGGTIPAFVAMLSDP